MIIESDNVSIDEHVVLSKFEGDALPENEIERLSIKNGIVVGHEIIENGEVVGTVPDSAVLGKDIGRLVSDDSEGR